MTEDSAVNPLQLKFIQMVCRLVLQLGIDSTTLHFCSYAGAYVALSVDQAIHSASHKSLQYLEYQVGAKLWLPVFRSAQGLDVQWEPLCDSFNYSSHGYSIELRSFSVDSERIPTASYCAWLGRADHR